MKLTILGCAGTFPGPASGCSSYLLEHDGFRLMIDAGYGAVGALQRHGGLLDLDAVAISHLHADHCIDLVGYAYARHYHPGGCPPKLPVWGPTGTSGRIADAVGGRPGWLDDVYDWHELDAGVRSIGPFTLTTRRTAHPIECWGMRLEAGGRSMAFSGDTGPCAALVELARDTDLLLCEASFRDGPDNPPDLHLSGRQAAEQAVEAGARSLLLTHLVSWYSEDDILAEAAAVFPGELRLARDGLSYDI